MKVRIAGTRGIPAKHGGFETFAERLSLYLVSRGWEVCVYCQEQRTGPIHEDTWRGVGRVHIPVASESAVGTIVFDWKSVLHALGEPGLVLVLGYNTAVFSALLRLRGRRVVFNMDGIEWGRAKWNYAERAWLYVNDWFGCWLGNHLVADHPEIAHHLAKRTRSSKITTIPYGAPEVTAAAPELLTEYGLTPGGYELLIARPEPENSILEVVRAYSARKRPGELVVLSTYHPETNAYHRRVMAAAGEQVRFVGAIYDHAKVESLRFHARLYIHGHQVGGTNPSLVEALAAGSPVLAHDNRFNRWVAGPEARYFTGSDECVAAFDELLGDAAKLAGMAAASRQRYREAFLPQMELEAYEHCLSRWA